MVKAAAPPIPPAQPHSSVLGTVLHAVADVLGGPRTRPAVDPNTGEITHPELSNRQRIANTTGMYLKAAAAGLAAHGPGAIGQAGILGAQSAEQTKEAQNKQTQEEAQLTQSNLASKATIAYHNAQMLLEQRNMDRLDQENKDRIAESNRNFESLVTEKGWQRPPIIVDGKNINDGDPKNEPALMKYFSDGANHKAPDGYAFSYVPVPGKDGVGHQVYLAPIDSMKQPITVSRDDYKTQTGIDLPQGAPNATLPLGDLIAQRSMFAKQNNEAQQTKLEQEKFDVMKQNAPAELRHLNAETENLKGEAAQHFAEAKALGNQAYDTPDLTGTKIDPPQGGAKEVNSRIKEFKKNIDDLAQGEGSMKQFQSVLDDLDAGKDMTGAQSVVTLFNAIGLSTKPLKGQGMRVLQSTVASHENATGLPDKLYRELLNLKAGDVITPNMVRAYATILGDSRTSQYVNLVNEMHGQHLKADPALSLLQGQGKPLNPRSLTDRSTWNIFLQTAGGDPVKAEAMAHQLGWQ
jgi:hypothetical protein